MSEATLNLERHLKAAQSKRPGWAVGLWGEAGVGKSFTVQTLLRQSPIAGLSLHSTASLQSLAGSLPHHDKLPLWAKQVLERQAKNESVPPQNLIEALVAALSHLAPFVLHLEDIHEAGEERLEWIQKLAGLMSGLRGVGLIVTSRAEPTEPFKSYRLEPLDSAQLGELLQTQAKAKLPQEGLDWMFARTGGNPLFALEFWRYLLRQGFFWSDGEHWHWRTPPEGFVPVSVEALILQMLSLLSDQTSRTVLEARAILPAELSGEALNTLWTAVSGTDVETLAEAKHILHSKGILHGDHFAHPLMREVVEQEIAPAHKQGYARQALGALQQNPQLAVAYVDKAGLGTEQQLEWFIRASEAAEVAGNLIQAGRWLARAADLAIGPERGTLARRASGFLLQVDIQEATRLAEIAVQENPHDPQALISLAGSYARNGLFAQMEQVVQKLPKDATAQASWVKQLFLIRTNQRDFAGVLELWKEHPELHTNPGPTIAYQVAFARMELGDPQSAEALAVTALEAADLDAHQKAGLYAVRGLSWRLMDDPEQALSLLNQAVEWARIAGLPLGLSSALHNRQIVLEMLAMVPQRLADLSEALEIYRGAADPIRYASSLTSLGLALSYSGQYEEAEVKLMEAHQILLRFGDSAFLCNCETNLGSLYLSWRPPHALQLAQKYARLALERAGRIGPGPLGKALNLASLVASETGQAEQGLTLAEQCLGMDQIISEVRASAHSAKAVALEALGRPREAMVELEAARALVTGVPARKFDLELHRLRGAKDEGREGLEWFQERGLWATVYETQRKWPELNEAPPVVEVTEDFSVYIKVLGVPGLEQAGQALPVRAKKRLEVLCYLLEARIAGRAEVDILELVDVFYPDMPEDRAKLTLRQLIYLIRTNLGEGSIQSTSVGYALGAVGSDIEDFLKTADPSLWRGPYLQGLSDGWNANVRDGLVLALRSRVETLLSTDAVEAARLGEIWLEMEPYDEEALLFTLQALQHQGKTKAAERTYQQAQARLQEVGESLPERLEDFLRTVAV